jgi:ankyrin repeat protein
VALNGGIHAQESECDRLFLKAVRDNDLSGVRLHLSHSWGNLNVKDATGKTGLMYAVEAENRQLVDELLNANKAVCNPNLEDAKGMTALMYAIQKNNLIITEILLKEGSGVNVNYQTTGQRNTALHYAVQSRLDRMVKLLLENKLTATTQTDINGDTAFMIAVKNNSRAMIKLFADSPRFDVTQRPDDGIPPLLFAIQKRLPLPTIQNILDYCIDAITSVDDRGRDAFQYQSAYSDARSVRYDDSLLDMLKAADSKYKKLQGF